MSTKNKTAANLAEQMRDDAPLASTSKEETAPAKNNGRIKPPEDSEPEGPIDTDELQRQLQAARSPRRSTQTKASKARQLLGSDERLFVWKVGETGKEEWCNEYSIDEVQRSSSLEGFVTKYLVPHYDYGEYVLRAGKPGTARDKLAYMGSIFIRRPKDDNAPVTRETSAIHELIEASQRLQDRAQSGKVDPVESLDRMLTIQERLNQGKGDNATAMMLMMMMDQQKSGQSMDPILVKLVERLDKIEQRISRRAESPPMPQLPPPPPPPDPMEGFSKMLEAFAAMQKSMQPPPPPPPPPQSSRQEFLQELQMMREMFGANKEEMGFRDYIALMKEIRELDGSSRLPGQQGPRTLEDQLKEYRHMRSVFGEMSQEFGGSAGGFWDFARDFLSGSPVGQRLGDALEEAIGGKKETSQQNPNRQLPKGDDDSEDDDEDDALEIPKSFNPFAQKMDEMAKLDDKAMLIRTTLEGLQKLATTSPDFRPYVMKVIQLARKNKKKDCLKLLGEMLLGIHEAGVIENVDTVKKVIFGMREHWLAVCTALGMTHEEDPDPYIPHTENRASSRVPPVGVKQQQEPQETEPEVDDDDDEVELSEEDYERYARAATGDAEVKPPEEQQEADGPEEEEPPTPHEPEPEDESSEPEPAGEVDEGEVELEQDVNDVREPEPAQT